MPFSDDKKALVAPHHDGVNRFEIRSEILNIHKHSRLMDYKRQLDEELFGSLKKIVCVRNPWDRCVSYYFSPHRGEVSWSEPMFEDFVRNQIHPYSYYCSVEDQRDEPFECFDYIIRFENIESDFDHLCAELGLGRVLLPNLNVSKRQNYRTYFGNPRLIDLVAEKFSVEIDHFGYRF
jgi:Sulfotransferase family